MINLHSPVRKGALISQDGLLEVKELIARGSTEVMVKAVGKGSGEELDGGMEIDLDSMVNFCKQVLMETGTLPKWFYLGVVVDIFHNQIMTYFSPTKEKFFTEIYLEIQENLPPELPITDQETVVKNFFENNRDFQFSYSMISLDSLLTGTTGGNVEVTDMQN